MRVVVHRYIGTLRLPAADAALPEPFLLQAKKKKKKKKIRSSFVQAVQPLHRLKGGTANPQKIPVLI